MQCWLHNAGQLVRKELKCFYLPRQIFTLLVQAPKQLTLPKAHGHMRDCREHAALHRSTVRGIGTVTSQPHKGLVPAA